MEKARISIAVLIFSDFRQDFSVADDLETAKALPAFSDVQSVAAKNSPDIRAAQSAAL